MGHKVDMSDSGPDGYTVLARKYRPQTFDALIGQDALVRVLKNAFDRQKIPHALLLTGVRGVGKTTTARIVAKGLNCAEADGPTITPCGVCAQCRAIAESRHVDVLEMDAASRTGIDDIREIIDSVKYRAAQGRYKVYIVDEAHMLSKNAFNGLLKTLEEPPEHAKFILATTDAHKIPVTVLSRCMRFDLRRVTPERLAAHMGEICAQETVEATPEALALIARAAEGSVRDSLSLLDQAIAFGGGALDAEAARAMLGLADRAQVFALFDAVMTGQPKAALETAQTLYQNGAEPLAILRDLADACHLATLAKAAPERLEDPSLAPAERAAAETAAGAYGVRALGRAWQMILKALEEAARAPSAMAAVEMALLRMCHVADLPTPDELVRALGDGAGANVGAGAGVQNGGSAGGPRAAAPAQAPRAAAAAGSQQRAQQRAQDRPQAGGREVDQAGRLTARGGDDGPRLRAVGDTGGGAAPDPAPRAEPEPRAVEGPQLSAPPENFEEILALIRDRRDGKLQADIERFVRPGAVRGRSFEFTPAAGAPDDLAARLSERLGAWTGARFVVSISDAHDAPTIFEAKRGVEDDLRARARAHPAVQAALAAFPEAEIRSVRDRFAFAAPGASDDASTAALEPADMDDLLDGAAFDAPYDD